jgi:hypothetical protein
MKTLNFILRLFLLLLVGCLLCQCKVSQVCLRYYQCKNSNDTDRVVRLYMDKFGSLYPNIHVPIDTNSFYKHRFLKRAAFDSTSASLEHYFTSDPKRLASLQAVYHVETLQTIKLTYQAVQNCIIAGYVNEIKALAEKENSRQIVFLIHGFNDVIATQEYKQIRDSIKDLGYTASKKLLFVEIYWDGQTAFGYNQLKAARIWKPARLNSRWAGLLLRNFILKMEDGLMTPLPIVMITHSLGAGVATGALFNTRCRDFTKSDKDFDAQRKLNVLMAIQTPTVDVRVGMLAPAIPGETTFIDFNHRSPNPITAPGQNHISRVIIAYNPLDYATTKDLWRLSFARYFGSTTLGCNYFYHKDRSTEIERMFKIMTGLGYSVYDLPPIFLPIQFDTPVRPGSLGNHQHLMQYYVGDSAHVRPFLDGLFDD